MLRSFELIKIIKSLSVQDPVIPYNVILGKSFISYEFELKGYLKNLQDLGWISDDPDSGLVQLTDFGQRLFN